MTQETQSVRTTNKFGRTVYKKTIDDKLTDAQVKRTTVIKKVGFQRNQLRQSFQNERQYF